MARHALLIGVSEFADERLARLNAPTNDVTALRGILQDSSRGNFDSVELSLNEDFLTVRDHLSASSMIVRRTMFCCSTIRAMEFWAAATGYFWRPAAPTWIRRAPAVFTAQEIRDFIEDSRAQRQIVVLDCCHSGAFAEHAKAAVPPPAVTLEYLFER